MKCLYNRLVNKLNKVHDLDKSDERMYQRGLQINKWNIIAFIYFHA